MISFLICILNLISIFFEMNYIISLGLNPSLSPFNYLWWILFSDIILQIGIVIVNILYLLWSILTCCASKENTLLNFSVFKSITIFYFLGSSLFTFYKFMENLPSIKIFTNFYYLLIVYFVAFFTILFILFTYRMIQCYKKRNQPKYNHLVNDENHIEINLIDNN